ncbi:MAG: hypothetical protein K6T90_03100 [Leptolyngbyaceae cyanobacterium HOT.MB2.61]|nr:hypothetical protein [Leptolyngbyaceae cyanobacterium HOT.MB2.61]
MSVLENNALFTEITAEDSAQINGGRRYYYRPCHTSCYTSCYNPYYYGTSYDSYGYGYTYVAGYSYVVPTYTYYYYYRY